jgi:hypothetical protein
MNTHFSNALRITALTLCGLLSTSAMAQRPTDQPAARGNVHMQLDVRHNHNRYYPAPGAVVRTVPRGAYVTRYHGAPYYFQGGIWYRHAGPGYIVARPPLGAFITVLPPFYTTVWFGGLPYYYADNVYYRWDADDRGYVVAAPPDGSPYDSDSGSDDSTPTVANNDLFIYPKNGQSTDQQATDRYECHRWAADQTSFDPTKSQGGVETAEVDNKRGDYQRAQTACLEARGYSVK